MSKRQKIALIVTASVVVLMWLFPPFHVVGYGPTRNLGYGFLLTPPKLADDVTASVNIGMLVAQWAMAAGLGAMAWLFFRDPTPRH